MIGPITAALCWAHARRHGSVAVRRAFSPLDRILGRRTDRLYAAPLGSVCPLPRRRRICLTNNAAERALRGFALGRKSWLFAGSERGADRAAVMATLIMTAKLNDVDPQAWLADLLARIAHRPRKVIGARRTMRWAQDSKRVLSCFGGPRFWLGDGPKAAKLSQLKGQMVARGVHRMEKRLRLDSRC
jgi:hypothetical protein